jgi:phosphatidylserine/phosphatidylglycerophosphate/cardiolipin synthase-like enzyme
VTYDVATCAVSGIRAFFLSRRAGIDADPATRLVRFIQRAYYSIDIAIYDFRHVEVLAAVRSAVRRGCHLRIVYDAGEPPHAGSGADPKPSGMVKALTQFGLMKYARAVHRTSTSYMHHKFIVRDGEAVWTGTGNFTAGAFELQDNNFVVIRSHDLATRYLAVFDRIWATPAQMARIPRGIGGNFITDISGAWVRPYFEPVAKGQVELFIARILRGANKVRLMAFEMSDPDILHAFARFSPSAANVRGIFDVNGMKGAVSRIKHLDPAIYWWYNGDARFVGVKSHPFNALPNGLNDFHHNKTFIVDDRIVITGSYNFSEHAESNYEDLLCIRSRRLAAGYARYFRAMFRHYQASAGG